MNHCYLLVLCIGRCALNENKVSESSQLDWRATQSFSVTLRLALPEHLFDKLNNLSGRVAFQQKISRIFFPIKNVMPFGSMQQSRQWKWLGPSVVSIATYEIFCSQFFRFFTFCRRYWHWPIRVFSSTCDIVINASNTKKDTTVNHLNHSWWLNF